MSSFYELQKKRRSIYALGKNVDISKEEITDLIKNVVNESPTAYNSMSNRIVILWGEEHNKLWELVKASIKAVVSEEDYPSSEQKINCAFQSGIGTILFYEDRKTIEELKKKFPLYAESFPKYAQQSNGMSQYAVWTALAEKGIGASLQHYNELIEDKLREIFNIPSEWILISQMPFGSKEAAPNEKNYLSDDERFKVLGLDG